MTRRNGDANGDGISARRLMHKPLVIPIALAITITSAAIGIAYGYGGLNADVTRIGDRVDRMEEQVQDQLTNINKRLDDLFKLLSAPRWVR